MSDLEVTHGLELALTRLFDLYPGAEPAFKSPARILLRIVSPSGSVVRDAMDVLWDAMPLLKWLEDNTPILTTELAPAFLPLGGSIADRIHRYFDTPGFEPDDAQIDALYEYRRTHGLRFALRGVDIDDVYLGRAESGFEISCAKDEGSWRYRVDLPRFLRAIHPLTIRPPGKGRPYCLQ